MTFAHVYNKIQNEDNTIKHKIVHNLKNHTRGLSNRPTKCRYLATKRRCRGNYFCLSIYGVYVGATWRIRLNRPCAAEMRPYIKLL